MSNQQSAEAALYSLNDPTQSVYVREQALRILAQTPTSEHLARMIQALEDEHFGVRWEAAALLAELGEVALRPLLRALVYQHDSVWLREGAHHICYYSSSPQVREWTQPLQKALRGSAAEVATTDAAAKLLQSLSY
ncbi:MAG: HEAT repeat domain-containing protein [Caldilineaceae bacterium]